MKKLFFLIVCLSVITLLAFQENNSSAQSTPSVSEPILKKTTSDTSDIDEEMRKLEAEMRILEQKMKPFELEMREYEKKMKPFQAEMREWEKKMKPYEKQLHELERKMRKAETEEERKAISKEMSLIGDKMGEVGTQMSAIGDKMGNVGKDMGEIGDKMGKIGSEMGLVGNKMSIVGEKMEKRHKKIFSWFFQELKKDGFLSDDKCSVLLEQSIMVVNGQTLSKEQLEKYKKGIENRLGKSLKSDFSVYFKGVIKNMTEEGFDFDGQMNSSY